LIDHEELIPDLWKRFDDMQAALVSLVLKGGFCVTRPSSMKEKGHGLFVLP
jgi:hypothetical protein